jgi:hypothetical protein
LLAQLYFIGDLFRFGFIHHQKKFLMLRGFEESSLPNAAGQWIRWVGK